MALFAGAILITAFTTRAEVISVNWQQAGTTTGVSNNVSDGYGVVPGINWLNTTSSGNLTGLPLGSGGTSGVGLNITNGGSTTITNFNYSLTNVLESTPMRAGSRLTTAAGARGLLFTNLLTVFPGNYDIIIYITGFNAAANGNTAVVTLGATTYYCKVPNPFTGSLIQSSDTVDSTVDDEGTYVRFSGLSGNIQNIVVTRQNGEVGIGGFQIVGTSYTELAPNWTGSIDNNWDTTTLNWTNSIYGATNYTEGKVVVFGDAAVATSPLVILAASRSPASVTVDSAKNYIFTGSGNTMATAGPLTLGGSGTVTISNTTFSVGKNVTFGSSSDGKKVTLVSGATFTGTNWTTTDNNDLTVNPGTTFTLSGSLNLSDTGATGGGSDLLFNGGTVGVGGVILLQPVSGASGTTLTISNNATVTAGYLSIQDPYSNGTAVELVSGSLTLSNTNALRGNNFATQRCNWSGAAGAFTLTQTDNTQSTTLASKVGQGYFSIDGSQIDPTADGTDIAVLNAELATLAVNGRILKVSISGGSQILALVTSAPPTLGYTPLGGGVLQFNWTGAYKLQWQTNAASVGLNTNWVDYPGGGTSPVNVTNNPAIPAAFFRLSQLP